MLHILRQAAPGQLNSPRNEQDQMTHCKKKTQPVNQEEKKVFRSPPPGIFEAVLKKTNRGITVCQNQNLLLFDFYL